MKKYNLSFKRIISRFIITFFVGILFGICMMPFLTVADGLLYAQRGAIGGQNMLRMVALWGLFTLLFSFFSFWKKRLRMVSILLIICFIISLIFIILMNATTYKQQSCNRTSTYNLPKEINRSLDLIAQRLDVENNNYGYFDMAMNYWNCLDIQYSDTNNLGEELEAYFSPAQSSLQQLTIVVNSNYQKFDDLSIATVLIHELTHVGQFIREQLKISDNLYESSSNDCFSQEAEAFTEQWKLLAVFNPEEQRSIYTRLQNNMTKNPAFIIILDLQKISDEVGYSCKQLEKTNALTTQQYNDCYWIGMKNRIEKVVRADDYYKKQCNQ